ncbi:ornithine cyclodeaminase [Rubricella aquisinus]|uniref:Ornithine cyclodeaminase n=1 Tax=Rubricella aquisinus TaxID=2028108 RepID=A0A840WL10_9RHOB|nr:ornithine cyclodeaminase [Rubricella aquisinus]MBB5515201.1 ornithine cyclodeaminase [Rubricella aquisinus]
MTSIPVIGPDDVAGRMDWVRLCDAMEAGHKGTKAQIGDQFLTRGDDILLSRAAWIDGLGVGVKSVTVFPQNVAASLPSVQGGMLVFDDTTGAPVALIDNALITYWKTAADSVLGARFLARKNAQHLLIVGAGRVAQSLIEAYPAVLPGIQKITVWNRTRSRAEALRTLHPHIEIADDLSEAMAEADIISTCTLTKTPIIAGADLRPGQHLDLIGAFTADMREADDAALQRGRIFVDSFDTTLDHIGELKIPIAAGVISRSDVLGDFRDLAAGKVGRQSDGDITVFKNGGGAHLDLMTARVILDAAG